MLSAFTEEDPLQKCGQDLREIGDNFNFLNKLGSVLVNGQTAQDNKAKADSSNENKTKKPNKWRPTGNKMRTDRGNIQHWVSE